MAVKTTSRKFELFAIHAHKGANVDYTQMMDLIVKTPPEKRVLINGDSALAVSKARKAEGLYFFTVVEGPIGVDPLIYDLVSASERTEELDDSEVLAERTHVLIDSIKRRAAIEYVRRGAKYYQVASVIEHVIRNSSQNMHSFGLDMSPVVEKDFLTEMSEFQRVRAARITVNKPNASWSDHYTGMSDIMDESNGDKASLEVNAPREGGLSKAKGVLKIIKDIVNDPQPYLQDVRLMGVRKGEDAETGHVNENQAFHHLNGLIKQ